MDQIKLALKVGRLDVDNAMDELCPLHFRELIEALSILEGEQTLEEADDRPNTMSMEDAVAYYQKMFSE